MQNRLKQSIILCCMLFSPLKAGGFKHVNTPISTYGKIVSRSTDSIKGATVEKVLLYPQGDCDEVCQQHCARKGILIRYPNAIGTIVMCHGFMCDKFDLGILRCIFPQGKYNFFSFDMRAHGEDKEGQHCTLGRDEAYDVAAAGNFVRSHPDLQHLPRYVYGFSMGAVSAIQAQAKDGTLFDAMILDCPYDSTAKVIQRGLSHLKVTLFGRSFTIPGTSLLQKYAFHPYVQYLLRLVLKSVANMDSTDIAMRILPVDPVESVKKIEKPVLYILCRNDAKVSVEGIKEVFKNTSSDYKVLRITNGRRHFDSCFYDPERYREYIHEFLQLIREPRVVKRQEIIEDLDDTVPLETAIDYIRGI